MLLKNPLSSDDFTQDCVSCLFSLLVLVKKKLMQIIPPLPLSVEKTSGATAVFPSSSRFISSPSVTYETRDLTPTSFNTDSYIWWQIIKFRM